MSVFRLTANPTDLYRPDSATSFERVSGVAQAVQHLRTRLRLFTREVFRDIRVGVEFFDIVNNPAVPPSAIANHIASVALDTPGIVDVQLQFDLEPVRGVVTITADAFYSASDQAARVPIHEVILVQFGGGSIIT